ncbi:MAG TPA: efflux transporter periplasmic adaptor subunit [Planctomycetaceae bacterium]|nr:efflux transporter periplasmic adaptor subunit [Planctomycetaceae bacterium]
MNQKLRRTAMLVMGAVFIAVAWLLLRPAPLLVDVALVSQGALTVTANEDGVTRIRERYEVSTPLAGRVLRLTHNVGDAVSADETILARMEPTHPDLLDPRAVAQAQARVMAAQRRLEIARLQLETAKAESQHAETERMRLYQLRDQDAVSESELNQATLTSRLKSDAQRTAQYTIEIADYELELERSALLLTKADGSTGPGKMELEIRAPINGRILRILHEDTAVIAAGTVLMEIGDPHDLEILVDVLSRDAVRINSGASVRILRWGGDAPLHGTVRYVEPSGFTKFSALGVEEQRVNVVIDLEEPAERRLQLGDAYRVETEIALWHADPVLKIPTHSLFRVGERWAAFFVIDGLAVQRELEIGKMNEREAEVLQGARVGDAVIEYPSDSIRSGLRVQASLARER